MSTIRWGSPGATSDSSGLNRLTAVRPTSWLPTAGSSLTARTSRTPTSSAPASVSCPPTTGTSTAVPAPSAPVVTTLTRSMAGSMLALIDSPSGIDDGSTPSATGRR